MKGFSPRNLKYMRAFAEAYPDEAVVQEALAQITWYHHITNFNRTLPAPQSDLAHEALKDPYLFDFLTVGSEAEERSVQRALLSHLRDFLLELGVGFSFIGSQYHLEIGDQDFYVDLLFYHLRLRCYIVIELKVGPFKPESAGKMNFSLSAVDDRLRQPSDHPSIGLIPCKERNKLVVEYALRDSKKPIGVAMYRLTERLPERLKGNLPTIQELEAELSEEGPPKKRRQDDAKG